MKKTLISVLLLVLFLAGCSQTAAPKPTDKQNTDSTANSKTDTPTPSSESPITFPIEEYATLRTFKSFGEYIDDRFTGYHAADDVEFTDRLSLLNEIPVYAIANGTVTYKSTVSGYGGLIRIQHSIQKEDGTSEIITALYGHLDLGSSDVKVGDTVTKGQTIANLGDHESTETDGERKHLHFGLYEGAAERINGYESNAAGLANWLNPQTFFRTHGLDTNTPARTFSPTQDRGGDILNIGFTIPENWEVEYVPGVEALNLFTLEGEGTARERSQIFIRYFDAAGFQTLRTVTIHSTEDLKIGTGNYTARRYDIEKNPDVPNFPDQPSWRNKRHTVTDFRAQEGQTRYFVIAANPDLDPKIYEAVLQSMKIF